MIRNTSPLSEVVMFLLIWSSRTVPGEAIPSITLSPVDHVTRPGATVTLQCTVADKTSDFLVAWIRDGQRITRSNNESLDNQHVDTTRYSLIGSTLQGDYSLMIETIRSRDAGEFRCVVYSHDANEVASSESATLTVEYVPNEDSFICLPRDVQELRVGSSLSFTCSSDTGSPPVSLAWSLNSEELNASTTDASSSFTTVTFEKTITVEDNGKVFVCDLSHDLIPEGRTCQVGPLDVIYEPRDLTITTSPSSALETPSEAVVNINQVITFVCAGMANPLENYTWTVQEADGCSKGEYHVASEDSLFLTQATMAYNGATITCTIRNIVGESSTSVTLRVVSDDPTELCYSTTSKPTTVPLQVTQKRTKAPTTEENVISTMHIIIIIIGVAFLLIIAILGYIAISRRRQPPIQLVHVTSGADDTRSLSEASIIFHSRHNTPNPERGNSLGRMQSNFSTMTYDTQSIDSATALMHLKSLESPDCKANPKLTGSPTRKLKGGKEFQVHEIDNSPFHRFDSMDNTYESSPRRMPPTSTPKSTLTRQPSEHKYEECPTTMKKYTTHASQTDLTIVGNTIEERQEIYDTSDTDSDVEYDPPKKNFSINNCNINCVKHTDV